MAKEVYEKGDRVEIRPNNHAHLAGLAGQRGVVTETPASMWELVSIITDSGLVRVIDPGCLMLASESKTV